MHCAQITPKTIWETKVEGIKTEEIIIAIRVATEILEIAEVRTATTTLMATQTKEALGLRKAQGITEVEEEEEVETLVDPEGNDAASMVNKCT